MRKQFAELIHTEMKCNESIFLISVDMGYGMWDSVASSYPTRFVNTGAAEQLALGVAVGLALSGYIPLVYSITPFLLCRPYEWIRNYLNHELIPVKLIGSGRNQDYAHDGFTHDASDDVDIVYELKNVVEYRPWTVDEMIRDTHLMLKNGKPSYLNLRRI